MAIDLERVEAERERIKQTYLRRRPTDLPRPPAASITLPSSPRMSSRPCASTRRFSSSR